MCKKSNFLRALHRKTMHDVEGIWEPRHWNAEDAAKNILPLEWCLRYIIKGDILRFCPLKLKKYFWK